MRMACEKPNYMIDFGVDSVTLKHKTRFLFNGKQYEQRNLAMLQKYNNDGVTKVYPIPCGKCPSCIKQYRLQWSLPFKSSGKLSKALTPSITALKASVLFLGTLE